MESETKQSYPCINGLSKPLSEGQMVEKKKANFRLLKDPFLDDKVQKKMYRYDGMMPGGESIDLKDPRRRSNPRTNPRYRLWSSRQVMDLDVPRFKYDQNYIGTPPPNEVTFTNLNDNIDSKFLGNMCKHFGTVEEIKIYHHPKTKKHMGIGKVLFTFSKCAKACVDKLHQTSKMGNIINVIIDTMGKERSRIIEELLADKPKSARRPVPPPPPPERIDPRSHGRLYATASTSSSRSVASCNFPPAKSKYNDYGMEAYDPGDTEFDFGNAGGHRQLVNPPHENTSYSDSDYGSMQHCDSGYSVPQSEMSFSGHSDISSTSYDGYSQYSSQHTPGNRGWPHTPHATSYSSYGVTQQYAQHNSSRHVNTSYSQHYSQSSYDTGHQPPCPPPEPPTHSSHAESSSRSHSYSERRDEYKDRSTPSFSQHHWEKEREREINSREKSREKEHRIRPKTPEPEEPRNQSLESRLQSIFGLGGLGSPTESNRSKEHSSPSTTPRSRDEMCTPSPGIDSRYSSQQYPVSSRTSSSSSSSCSSHVLQMPPLPPDNDEETKLPPTPTNKSDSSDRLDYSRESSTRSKRFEFKNSLDHSDSVAHYDAIKTDKVTPAIASNSSSVNTTSRYRTTESNDKCSNGLLVAASADFASSNQPTKCFPSSVVPPLPKQMPPVEEKMEEKENNVDMEIDDDDDRMSLSSISSGEEKLEVNVQLPSNDGKFTTNNFQSLSSTQAPIAAPPVPLITDFSRPPPGMQPWSFSSAYSFGNYPAAPTRMELTTGTFNQSYCSQIPGSLMPMNYAGQSLTDSSLSQVGAANNITGRVGENHRQQQLKEEKDPNDKTFLFVLDHFVRELKEVMQKDLCKKMVENSAFKSFELWWDAEEQKSKFQKDSGSTDKAAVNKESPIKSDKKSNTNAQSGGQLTPGKSDVNPALASLFETQHPWRQEGGFEAHYGGAHGGGFLGIRGVMPRMPSFKKKVFRPPSPPPPDDEDSKAAESFASNAEDESDDDVVGASPSIRKKNVYASDEESASDDEKSDATASEDDEASDESSEDESDEEASDETSDTSEEGSDEEDEEDEESEAKTKNDSESETKRFPISSESEKMVSTNKITDQTSVEESDLEMESRKISEDSTKESSSETESEVEDSERDTTESSSDAEPDEQSMLFKPQLSPIKEEEEHDDLNRDEKVSVSEKSSLSSDHERTTESRKVTGRIDSEMSSLVEKSTVDSISVTTDMSYDDQTTSSSNESRKTSSRVLDDINENRETIIATTTDEEVPSADISSEVTTTSDEEISKTDHSKIYANQSIAEHDYVAMPPPLPVGPVLKSSEEFDHIDEPEEGEIVEEEEEVVDDYDDSDRTESCDEDNTPLEILMDHNYCLPSAISEIQDDLEISAGWPEKKVLSGNLLKDNKLNNSAANAAVQDVVQKLAADSLTADQHAAAATAAVVAAAAAAVSASQAAANTESLRKPKKKKKRVKNNTLTDITNKSMYEHEAEAIKPVVKPKIKFQPRGYQEEKQLFFDIYNKGIDQEDINYLKRTYETLLKSEDPMYDWLNDIFWVDHTQTDIPDPVPPKKKRKADEQITPVHKTGSARTEGFYKISNREKAGYLNHANKAAEETAQQQNEKKLSMTSREARHNIRRFQTNFGDLELGELFKFNQLKFRKKQLRFAKSSIHDWGLFALEPIAAEEMVIEYVGQVIRHFVADEREKQYGAQGIGSSYLFRVDNETIIDATKAGNLARFINHSCNPNCYAKIITVEAHKKIVIYSKRDIDVNEEITYDYKFPLEEEKISCLCGAQGCKGTLN